MILKPWSRRDRTVAELQPLVREELSHIRGHNIFPVTPAALPVVGSNFPVELIVAATAEPERILKFVKRIRQRA